MWMQVNDGNLPDELAEATSSIWQYGELARVGVMRGRTMLMPPYLWAEVYQSNPAALRASQNLLDGFQELIHAPIVYAEANENDRMNRHFLRFLGFTSIAVQADRHLFKRSIV